MTQYARPDSDISATSWTGAYSTIDEVSYSDADYLQGAENANGTAEKGLSDVTDPVSSSDHIVRFRAWQENDTHQRTLSVILVQGSTTISTYVAFNLVKGTATSYSWTLSPAEADAISNYTDLRIRFTSGGTVSIPTSSQSDVFVSWAELEVPDASSKSIDVFDSVNVSENITIQQSCYNINVYDSVTVAEDIATSLSGAIAPLSIPSSFSVDSYASTNGEVYAQLNGTNLAIGQSFTGVAGDIYQAVFYLKKNTSPTGNAYAKLYSHSGTYGTSSAGDALLATSDPVDVGTISADGEAVTFTFTGSNQYLMDSSYYCIVVEYTNGDPTNNIQIFNDESSPSHSGNLVYYTTGWNYTADDTVFYVYAVTIPKSGVTVSEDITIEEITPVVDLEIPDVFDSVNVSEDLTILRAEHNISVYSSANVSENITSKVPLEFIDVFDSIGVSESVEAQVLLGEFTVVGIQDNFDDNDRNTGLWNLATGDADVTVSEANGQLEITLANATVGANYDGYSSASAFDFNDKCAYVEVVEAPSNSTGAQALLSLEATNGDVIRINKEGTGLFFQYYPNGEGATTVDSVAYDNTTHRWWRIREDSGTLYYDTSTDGVGWTNRASVGTPVAITAMAVVLKGGTYQSETSPGNVIFDNINTDGSGTTAIVGDAVNISEDVTVLRTSHNVDVYDSLTATEVITTGTTPKEVNVYDSITTTEDITTGGETAYWDVSVYDSVTTTENITVLQTNLVLSVFDGITVTEDTTGGTTLGIELDGTVVTSETTATNGITVADHENRLLLVSFATYQGGGPSGITYNSTPLTKIVEQIGQFNEHASIWGLIAPEVGTYNVVLSGVSAYYAVGIYSLYNTDIYLPNNTSKVSTTGTTTSLAITTQSDNSWVITCIEPEALPTMTTEGATEDWIQGAETYQNAEGHHILKGTAGSQTMTSSLAYDCRYNQVNVEVKESGQTTFYINVYDSVTVSEDITAEAVSEVTSLSISAVYDSINVSESITAGSNLLEVSVFDIQTATENIIVIEKNLLASVFDSLTATESITALQANYVLSVFDSVTISEDVTVTQVGVELPKEIDTYESITVSEENYKALVFDGVDDYVEVTDNDAYSVSTTGALTVSFWMRPDVLNYTLNTGSDQYVNLLGKSQTGSPNTEEWEFRIANYTGTYPSRISLYVFNSEGGLGMGSYISSAVTAGEWIHVVGTMDMYESYIYRDGAYAYHFHHQTTGTKATAICTISGGAVNTITLTNAGTSYVNTPKVNLYGGGGSGASATCTISGGIVTSLTLTAGGSGYTSAPTVVIGINSENTSANLRFGHCEDESDPGYFEGAIRDVRIWNRVLTSSEVGDVYTGSPSDTGLVGRWKIDDLSETTVKDTAGTSDGSFSSSPVWIGQDVLITELKVSVYDSVGISDDQSSLYDGISVSEDSDSDIPSGEYVDSIVVSEHISIRVPATFVSVYDGIAVSESVTLLKVLGEASYDINLYDSVGISEDTTVNTNFLSISITDSLAVADYVRGHNLGGWEYMGDWTTPWSDTSDSSSTWTNTSDASTIWTLIDSEPDN